MIKRSRALARFMLEDDDVLSQALRFQAKGRAFHAGGQGGKGIDFKPDPVVAVHQSFDQRCADAGKRLQDRHVPPLGVRQIVPERVRDETGGKSRDPGNPAVNGILFVVLERGVAKERADLFRDSWGSSQNRCFF